MPWEEVLCDGFDLKVLDTSGRRGTDTYVSLPLRITRWGLRLVTTGRNLGVTSHTPIQLCLCGTYLMKREVLVVTS